MYNVIFGENKLKDILLNLEETIKEEKELNNIEPNQLSLKQMKEILSAYNECFKYLPRVVLYPSTKDIGLAWSIKKDYYVNLFFIKNEKILYLIDFPNKERRGIVPSSIKDFNETISIIENEIISLLKEKIERLENENIGLQQQRKK